MSETMIRIQQDNEPNTTTPAADRRRPGRAEDCAEALIPLFRRSEFPMTEDAFDNDDDLGPSRGLAIAVLLSLTMWVPLLSLLH